MKVSVIVPTHRVSPGALARIMEVSALDAQSFEVVVRDNSGDRSKVSALHGLASESVKVHAVAPCGAFENAIEAFRLATGEFVFFLADDDWISVRTLRRVHSLAAAALEDRSVASIHADTFIETSAGAGIVHYDGLDDAFWGNLQAIGLLPVSAPACRLHIDTCQPARLGAANLRPTRVRLRPSRASSYSARAHAAPRRPRSTAPRP